MADPTPPTTTAGEAEFNPWEHLQDVVRKVYKQEVLEEFKDLGDIDLKDIKTSRSSLRTACLPDDNDTSSMTIIRMMLFYIVLRRAQDMQAPIYGMPTTQYDESWRYRPTITLYFREDKQDTDPDFHPLRVQISFRLADETETTITKAKLTTLANKVKSEFGGANAYKWHKGKTRCVYTEPEKGYNIRVFAYSVPEGKEVIGKVLDLQNDTPDWSKLTINENDQASSAYPTLPPMKTILGEQVRMPRKRPVGYVRFERATCQIYGKTKPVTLYDRTGRRFDALVT